MTEMTDVFLGTFETLRSVKQAIDDQMGAGEGDDAALERLQSLSGLHAAMARKLQDLMLDQGASPGLQAEVQRLREAFENTQGEIALRLWTRRGSPMPSRDDPGDEEVSRTEDAAEAELLQEAFKQTKRLFALQLRARREQPSSSTSAARKLRRDQERRSQADTAIRVFHRDQGFLAELLEVTSSGARLAAAKRAPVDARVTIRYLHLTIRARVDRSDDTGMVVEFRSSLSPQEVQLLREAAGRRLGSASAAALLGK